MKMPDAWAVYLPSPSVARLKMEAHMMEVQRPHSTMSNALTGTMVMSKEEPVNKGMSTVIDFGASMAAIIKTMPTALVQSIMVRDDILSAMNPAMNRPTSINSQ